MKNTLIYILKVRLQEIISNRIFKFVVVGGIGALYSVCNTGDLSSVDGVYARLFPLGRSGSWIKFCPFSNMWTFNDRSLTLPEIPKKFLTF